MAFFPEHKTALPWAFYRATHTCIYA